MKGGEYVLAVSFQGQDSRLERAIVRLVGWAEERKECLRESDAGTFTVMYFNFRDRAIRDAARERITEHRARLNLGRIDRYDINPEGD